MASDDVALSGFSSVVLAAGKSTRMGRDKATLEREGVPLWRRQRDVLRRAGASEVLLSARGEQEWVARAEGFAAVVQDAVPGGGPLMGIAAALEWTRYPWVAVLAVDLPAMAPEWIAALRAGCDAGVGVVGRREGYFEPLAAVYPREIVSLAREAIAEGRYSLQRLIGQAVEGGLLRVREVAAEERAWFDNWNEPRRDE